MPRKLARDEYRYTAERDHLNDATPCACGACDWKGAYDLLAPIGDCSLTPGDVSPAGRCPECDSLAYPVSAKDMAKDAAPRLLALLAKLTPYAESHAEDWESGLEDGTYTDAAGCQELRQAIGEARDLLAELIPPRKLCTAYTAIIAARAEEA